MRLSLSWLSLLLNPVTSRKLTQEVITFKQKNLKKYLHIFKLIIALTLHVTNTFSVKVNPFLSNFKFCFFESIQTRILYGAACGVICNLSTFVN